MFVFMRVATRQDQTQLNKAKSAGMSSDDKRK